MRASHSASARVSFRIGVTSSAPPRPAAAASTQHRISRPASWLPLVPAAPAALALASATETRRRRCASGGRRGGISIQQNGQVRGGARARTAAPCVARPRDTRRPGGRGSGAALPPLAPALLLTLTGDCAPAGSLAHVGRLRAPCRAPCSPARGRYCAPVNCARGSCEMGRRSGGGTPAGAWSGVAMAAPAPM